MKRFHQYLESGVATVGNRADVRFPSCTRHAMGIPSEYRIFELNGHKIRLSNPTKPYFPAVGITKEQLAEYYVDTADAVLNQVAERPVVLKRYAGGVESKPFFQKRV